MKGKDIFLDFKKQHALIYCEYLCINDRAVDKAFGHVFADIMTKVSHLVPIVFVDKADGKYVSLDSGGTFTRNKYSWETEWRAKHIGVVFDSDFQSTIRVLLHEVGHFVYMNYDNSLLTTFESSFKGDKAKALADIFVIDYIDTLPMWVQGALKIIRSVKISMIKEYHNITIEEKILKSKDVYDSLEENNLLYLLEMK